MRQGGVQPIDLPKVSDTFLTDLGYQFTVPKPAPVATQTAPATTPAKPDRSNAANDTKPSNEKSIVSRSPATGRAPSAARKAERSAPGLTCWRTET